ncbi:MAG: D-aminoacylase [Kordiimonadaceae bacterium]|nr:D-aminoacylase [Kordiimonadaceae bacterium]
MTLLRNLLIILTCFSAFPEKSAGANSQGKANSTLITNIQLIDGTGAAARAAALRIIGGKIVAIGMLEPLPGDDVVDGGGKVLAPGFIDTHSHHDITLLSGIGELATASQGITSIIVGQDGGSSYPLAEHFQFISSHPVAVNIGSYSGHNTLRDKVMGEASRVATPKEIFRMTALLEADMAAGAFGLSSGLGYEPGLYAASEEIIALAQKAAEYGGRYISHIRSEGIELEKALAEHIEIGRQAKLPVQVSHIKLAHRRHWGKADKFLRLFEAARAEGIDLTLDIYPYTYWQSTMKILFADRDYTNRETIENAFANIVIPEKLVFSNFSPNPDYVGKTIIEIAALRNQDPITAYMEMIQEFIAYEKAHPEQVVDEGIMAVSMIEADVDKLMAWSHTNICSDGSGEAGGHPRGFGSFPRVLGLYTREKGVLTLPQAVHKMTGLPAPHMGIKDRGLIKEGLQADLVLFDPETVIDRAELGKPQAISVGIETVWVNGEITYRDNALTGAKPGMVLRRQ